MNNFINRIITMKKTYKNWMTVLGLSGIVLLSACNSTPTNLKEISLLPLPNSVIKGDGAFVLPKKCNIGISDKSLTPAAEYLTSIMSSATGYTFNITDGKGDINLTLDQSNSSDAYNLTSNSKEVNITGHSYAGVIYGIETLRQLFPHQIEQKSIVSDTEWAIPAVTIDDAPRYQWRGLMLDVSRHFYNKAEVMQLLDLMALYKMNKFHWHLTDDQGWRVEIKKYPLLTEKGAWRKFNSQDKVCINRAEKEHNTDMLIPKDKLNIVKGDTLYGGFYTQQDIKEIVAYAQVRGIDVIPEIDMPGHMLAAVGNYNGISCFNETGWGTTFSSPVCPGKDSAIEFCKNVYSEIIPLFPYKYIHIGGDEVEKTNWKKCPDCQKRIRKEKLKSEEELQSWFIHEMESFFNANGKDMIGWDEIIEGGLSKTATVMWWRSWAKDAPEKTTGQGNNIIFTPNSQFYLDYAQDINSVPNIYNYNPADELTDTKEQKLILGVQGNIWCEWIPSNERLQYMAAPRMQAIAELGWSDSKEKDLEEFKERLTDQFERMNVMNINYRTPDLEGFYKSNTFIGETNVNVSCMDPSAKIHYTTDGSVPTLESPEYNGTLKISETTDFTFRTFKANGKPMDIVTTKFIKSTYSAATDVKPSHKGLEATWYDFRGNDCKDITSATKKGTYKIDNVSIPKEAKGNIGLVIEGYIEVPTDDIYTFFLTSDDGSTLVIDQDTVVDNNGPHAPKEVIGQKALSKGYHPIKVEYFDHNGGMLKLEIKDSKGNPISASVFAH